MAKPCKNARVQIQDKMMMNIWTSRNGAGAMEQIINIDNVVKVTRKLISSMLYWNMVVNIDFSLYE